MLRDAPYKVYESQWVGNTVTNVITLGYIRLKQAAFYSFVQ